jgi:hypothetical protein
LGESLTERRFASLSDFNIKQQTTNRRRYRNPARVLQILTYSLPLGQGQAHGEDYEDARHIDELGGWLNVAAEHDWGDCSR